MKMTKKQLRMKKEALERVKRKRTIYSSDLLALNLSFEHFLRFCQLPDLQCQLIISKLIEREEKKISSFIELCHDSLAIHGIDRGV
tara:strand:+ start:5293 stop:5550 length:258 start_codon:yes stop_codon:yes gene_type:complete